MAGHESRTEIGLPIDGKSIPHAYLRRLRLSPEGHAYLVKQNGRYQPITWSEVETRIQGIFAYLRSRQLTPGDRVCILSQTRPEWNLADIAIQCARLVTVPIYPSCNAEDTAYILRHSGARLVFAEDESQCRKLKEAMASGETLPVVCFSSPPPAVEGLAIEDFRKITEAPPSEEIARELTESARAVSPEDIATIVYTSGTTGQPKGVALRQSHILAELRAVIDEVDINAQDVLLTFLPFAHILARMESFLPVFAGLTMGFAEKIDTVAQNLAEVRPTLLVSVPRIYEKVYAKIVSGVESAPPLKKRMFEWAVGVGREMARRRSERQPVSLPLKAKYQVADQLVFSKVRERMGGRLRLTISGGAPLAAELCEFFHACGIRILEGYGLTETTAAVTCNRPDNYRFGTVGQPLSGAEIRIAEDGEILLRGPMVFDGYYNNPEATAEVMTKDGWFRSGDIGEIDDRGFLRITDRKKEIIVTSGGKNIAPQKIENLIKQVRFVNNVMVYGDKQKYLVALITANHDALEDWAKQNGGNYRRSDGVISEKEVLVLFEEEIRQVNAKLPSYETVKKFRLLGRDFTTESGELTPSLKLKRKVVTQSYNHLIEEMYGSARG